LQAEEMAEKMDFRATWPGVPEAFDGFEREKRGF
jgi:hypothetical protein